jgi:C-terminal processing protease CtpA/Prc
MGAPRLVVARRKRQIPADEVFEPSVESQFTCTDTEVFEKEVHKLLAELKISHTGFRHAGMRNIPARHAINATLQRIGVNGSERWMFQDVHQGGPAFAAGIRPGDLLLECGGREVARQSIMSGVGPTKALNRETDDCSLTARLTPSVPSATATFNITITFQGWQAPC